MAKWKQKGGGFFGRIESITFEDKTWQSDKARDGSYRTLTAKLMVKKDGADEAIEQYLPAGFLYDGQGVSKNGKTLTDKNSADSPIIDGESNFANFIDTVEEAGFDSAPFEASKYRNFEALEGQRFEFKNVMDADRQLASGKKKLGIKKDGVEKDGAVVYVGKGGKTYTEAEVLAAGKRDGKGDNKGKSFNQTRLTVVKVMAEDGGAADVDEDEDEEEAPPVKAAKGGKKVAKAEPVEADDDDDVEVEDAGPSNKEAIKFLNTLLKEEDGSINRGDLTLLVARKIKDRGERDAMTKKLYATDFLTQENGWSFNQSSKKQTITAE